MKYLHLLITVGLLALSLALVGCGSDGGGGSATGEPGETGAAGEPGGPGGPGTRPDR